MQENSKSFYDILRDSSPKFADQLDIIKKRGHEEWIPMLHFHEGSHGGYPHIRNVEHNADRLVPDKIKKEFEPGEIFLLLSAIFLHDIGKVITDNFSKKTPDSPCKKPKGELGEGCGLKIGEIKDREHHDKEEDPPCRKENKVHIYESLRIIREYWGMLGFPDERIAEYCAVIAFCHGLKYPLDPHDDKYTQNKCRKAKEIAANFRNTSLEPYGRLRVPLLASILRLADETDNSWTRSFEDYWLRNLKPESYSTFVKAFRRRVEDVEFCCAGQCIIMHIPETEREKEDKLNEKEIEILSNCRADTLEALSNWSEPLRVLGISYKDVFFEYNNYLYNDFDALYADINDRKADIKDGKKDNRPKYYVLFDGGINETKKMLEKLLYADKEKEILKILIDSGKFRETLEILVETDEKKTLKKLEAADETKEMSKELAKAEAGKIKEAMKQLAEAGKIKEALKKTNKAKEILEKLAEADEIKEALKKLIEADKTKGILRKLVDDNDLKETWKKLVESDDIKEALKKLIEADQTTEILKLAGSNEIKEALKKLMEADKIKGTLEKLAEADEIKEALRKLMEADKTKGILDKLAETDEIKEILKKLIEVNKTKGILEILAETEQIKKALNKITEDGTEEIKETLKPVEADNVEADKIKKALKRLIEADEAKGILKKLADVHEIKEMLKKLEEAEETKETLKKLVDAVIKLSLGSLGYERFRWRSLEGKIGRTLTDRDKWLVERLYPQSGKLLKVTFSPDSEYIEISFDSNDVKTIYDKLGIEPPGE